MQIKYTIPSRLDIFHKFNKKLEFIKLDNNIKIS